jgi:hypothetical protein
MAHHFGPVLKVAVPGLTELLQDDDFILMRPTTEVALERHSGLAMPITLLVVMLTHFHRLRTKSR